MFISFWRLSKYFLNYTFLYCNVCNFEYGIRVRMWKPLGIRLLLFGFKVQNAKKTLLISLDVVSV